MSATQKPGITVSTPIVVSGVQFNHGEGIVVPTTTVARIGGSGVWLNHAEGVVVPTGMVADGWSLNHAEGIVAG